MSRKNAWARSPVRRYPMRVCAVVSAATMAVAGLTASSVQAAGPSKKCSVVDLVAKINAANSSPGADTIHLSGKCVYRLTAPDPSSPANGLPPITSEITIEGHGATITRDDSAPDFRILFVPSGGDLTLNKTTISRGRATDCPTFPGLAVCGGGISSLGTLTVNHSRVIKNTAESATLFAEAGGIDSDGTGKLNHTEVSGNVARYTGGALNSADAGGVSNDGPLTVYRSRIVNNIVSITANTGGFAFGAGLSSFAPTTVKQSVISFNKAIAPGGTARGALANAVPASTVMTVTDTVLEGNTASAPGGTALGAAVASNAKLSMTDSRIIDNHASAPGTTTASGTAVGGGLSVGPVGDVALADTTLRDNSVNASGAGSSAVGGAINNSVGGTLRTVRTHIRGNTATTSGGGTARGGGLFNGGTSLLQWSKVTKNKAGDGGGIYEDSGTVTLTSTTVTDNDPNNCSPSGSVPGCVN
ncbi:hypothetical protein [Streptomyces sp. NPDC000410]|uniref:hypothetical protein n=1 Tax=Streptomyces sp. NPDC000410 TaxID=3154254 RepID=UPI0033192DD2